MAVPPPPLDSLAQQIARQQAELEALRQEYKTRQARLADLNRRKQDLQAQLQRVEADIQATTEGRAPGRAAAPAQTPKAKPATPRPHPTPLQAKPAAPLPKPTRSQTLPAFLVDIVRKATGPVPVRQLAQEVVRRKFPTTSGNVRRLVATKVKELVKRGILRRAPHQQGVVLARAAAGAPAAAAKAPPGPKKNTKTGQVVPRAATPPHTNGRPLPLRVLLTDLLAKRRRPVAARALAEQVLANGYRTKSKDFLEVVWVMLGKMDNVRNVPGQGYTLKQR
jgi:hypothetical protein